MAKSNKQVIIDFEQYKEQIKKATLVNHTETPAQKAARIKELLDDPVKFIKYYFPHHVKKEPSWFQKKALKRLKTLKRGMEVWRWFRGGSKSTIAMMAIIYRKQLGLIRCLIYVSKTSDKAEGLLSDLQAEFMENARLINDFGVQFNFGNWQDGYFKTKDGVAFYSLGKGQSPRGIKNGPDRPDTIIVDDIDDDEECRNTKRLDDSFEWLTGALYGCFGADGGLYLVLNNRIAEDCLTARISDLPGSNVDIIHLTNAKGESNWPEVFTPENIEYIKGEMPEYMFLREYYENIVKLGKTFKREWIQYGKVPPLQEIKYLLTYLDPGFKDTRTSDTKSVWLIGLYRGKFYIIKGFVDRASVSKMVEWHYDLDSFIKKNNAVARMWMEEVFLQDLLFKDFDQGALQFGYPLPLKGDTRKKPDKDARIESISGFFEKGHVIFNEEEKDNHNMQRLVSQFLMFQMGIKTPKDGPDSIEGGFFKLREMVINEPDPIFGKLNLNNKKF